MIKIDVQKAEDSNQAKSGTVELRLDEQKKKWTLTSSGNERLENINRK